MDFAPTTPVGTPVCARDSVGGALSEAQSENCVSLNVSKPKSGKREGVCARLKARDRAVQNIMTMQKFCIPITALSAPEAFGFFRLTSWLKYSKCAAIRQSGRIPENGATQTCAAR